MKLYLLGPYYPLRGGIAQYLAILGKRLEEGGHEIKVLAFRKQFPRYFFPGQTQQETSRDYIKLDSKALFVPWNPLSWWRTFLAVWRAKPSALIFKYWMPFFAPGYAAVCVLTRFFTSTRTICILDNVIPHERRLGDKFLTRLALRWVDGYIVQSDAVKRDLMSWFPTAIRRNILEVAHPVYDCYAGAHLSRREARDKLGIQSEKRLLLFFGLVRGYKGLDILLEALPRIISGLDAGVHLLIVGEFYEPEAAYRQKVSELGIDEQVSIINRYVPNEEVALYFQAADLLVLPYRSATQSGVVQIAYSYGLPVVSTRVGGLPETIKDGRTGFLVEPERPDLLSDAVLRFFNENRGEEFRQATLQEAKRYSWDGMISAIESIIL